MADSKGITGPQASGVPSELLEKLDAIREGIQQAYCMAVCVDYALLHKESDMDPEIAVCCGAHQNESGSTQQDETSAVSRSRARFVTMC